MNASARSIHGTLLAWLSIGLVAALAVAGTLTYLRARSEVPVLVLSARNDTADKVRALKLGADDYMTKPFSTHELVARVKSLLAANPA